MGGRRNAVSSHDCAIVIGIVSTSGPNVRDRRKREAGEMRTVFVRLLTLAVLFVPSYASAHVEINIDLGFPDMTVHSGSGETYVWPISSGKARHATPLAW